MFSTHGELDLSVCAIVGNMASSSFQQAFGGGVSLNDAGQFFNCTFEDNTAASRISHSFGGGVSSGKALVVLEQVIFRGNTVVGSGMWSSVIAFTF